jgi:YegS/Rv2252/BmrU family lipid kinase
LAGRNIVIINPISGPKRRGSAAKRVKQAEEAFDRLGITAEIRLTERRHHAYEFAQEAVQSGAALVVAWGGDGTVNEVARGLAFSQTSLGIVPGGSGNGLSRELKIPFYPPAALEHALRSPDRIIDAGELDGRLFFNIAGVGLDAHVAVTVGARIHHRGLIPYLASTLSDLVRYKPHDYVVEADGERFEISALMVVIANSPQYGFNTRIAPLAVVDDGLLDLVIVEHRGLSGNLWRFPTLFIGGVEKQRGITMRKVRSLSVRSSTPMPLHVDGEPVREVLEVHAHVRPGALRVRA